MKLIVLILVCFIPLFITPVFAESEQIEKECGAGYKISTGVCIMPKYDTAQKFNFPFDPEKGVEHYIDRYYFENEYKSWFDSNYPDLSIEEAVNLLQPYSTIKEQVDNCESIARKNYDEALKSYASAGGSLIGAEIYTGSLDDFIASCIETTGVIALNDVGIILAEKGLHEEAITYYDKALSLYPTYAIAITNKATSLLEMGKFEEAIPLYDKAINIWPDNEEIKSLRDYAIKQIQNESDIKCEKGTIKNEKGQCVPDSQTKGGGCLIATATYGSELSSQAQMLREIRDNSLMQTRSGQSFMKSFNSFYYSFSPTIADYERQNPVFKEATKLFITPMIYSLSIMTLAEEGSESQVLGFGISVIALNLGMYIAFPTTMIWQIKKRIC